MKINSEGQDEKNKSINYRFLSGTMYKDTCFSEENKIQRRQYYCLSFFSLFICRLVLFVSIATTCSSENLVIPTNCSESHFSCPSSQVNHSTAVIPQGLDCGQYVFIYLWVCCFFKLLLLSILLIHLSQWSCDEMNAWPELADKLRLFRDLIVSHSSCKLIFNRLVSCQSPQEIILYRRGHLLLS